MKKTVVISEDHSMFALMVKLWLEQTGQAEVLGVASTGKQTLELVESLQPDVLFQDMMLHDMSGLDIIRQIRTMMPSIAIFALTAMANMAKLAIDAGANGCMLKEDNPQVIRHALEWDIAMGIWVSPLLGERFYRAADDLLRYSFTPTEINILKNITSSNHEISLTLNISEGTVRNTLSTIYQKTGFTTRSELLKYTQDVLLIVPTPNQA